MSVTYTLRNDKTGAEVRVYSAKEADELISKGWRVTGVIDLDLSENREGESDKS
jgi:hypothetical protein